MRSPRLSASISRTGPCGLLGGREQRARERGEQRAQALERGDGEDAGGERQRAQQQAGERAERPRADVEAVAEVADAADAEDQQPRGDRDREEPGGEAEHRDRQLGRHEREHAPVRAVAERGDRAPPQRARSGGAGGVSGAMCASSRRLAWRRSISARRAQAASANSTSGRPIQIAPSAAPSTSSAASQRAHEAEREAEDEVLERLDRAAQPAAEVDRVGRRGAHGPLPTRTSPVVESACTWNGASSPVVTPRTLRLPSSLSASTR